MTICQRSHRMEPRFRAGAFSVAIACVNVRYSDLILWIAVHGPAVTLRRRAAHSSDAGNKNPTPKPEKRGRRQLDEKSDEKF